MAPFLTVVRTVALLLARVVLGGILLAHGWDRWQVRGVDSQVAYLQQFAVPYPSYAVGGAIGFELVGGVLLILGLLTPVVALAVVVEQVLIVAWTNWYRGPYLLDPEAAYVGGWEYNAVIAALALLLAAFGAGLVSVDRRLRPARRHTTEEEPALAYGRSGR